jgi:hypothetical protein
VAYHVESSRPQPLPHSGPSLVGVETDRPVGVHRCADIKGRPFRRVMEYCPPWSKRQYRTEESEASRSKMSMLTMAAPSHHAAFKRDYPWDGSRPSEYSSRPRTGPERVALPSIRQVLEDSAWTNSTDLMRLAGIPRTPSPHPTRCLGEDAILYHVTNCWLCWCDDPARICSLAEFEQATAVID